MRKLLLTFIMSFLFNQSYLYAQTETADKLKKDSNFFTRNYLFQDDIGLTPLEMTIETDFKKMRSEVHKGTYQDAAVTFHFPDSSEIKKNIRLYARGNFRRANCTTPGILLNFRNASESRKDNLKKIKLVCGCGTKSYEEQLLLKEYLIYKIYNQITDKSFHVRLFRVTYRDISKLKRQYVQYGFMVEDIKDLAKRNRCVVSKQPVFQNQGTDKMQMIIVELFEFMIGNTDWSVHNLHNVKLIKSIDKPSSYPFIVPFDFDFSGLVNAPYATPDPQLGIDKVTDRLYRGFSHSLEDLNLAFQVFESKKQDITNLVKYFEPLTEKERDYMQTFISEFYSVIEDPKKVRQILIDQARIN